MTIGHKFLNHDFNNGFASSNSILETLPYEPEVIFIGTFNPNWDWNKAGFYYGRGMYMWSILSNLFLYNSNTIKVQLIGETRNTPDSVFNICQTAKITFADIIKGTKFNIPTVLARKSFIVNNTYCWNSYKDHQLDFMGSQGWLDDNVENIIDYIKSKKSLKYVYFTFKSGGWLVDKMEYIKNNINVDVKCSLFTPSGNGFGKNLTAYPKRVTSLIHCWVWNGLQHQSAIDRQGYGHLDHDWLISKGVNPNNF